MGSGVAGENDAEVYGKGVEGQGTHERPADPYRKGLTTISQQVGRTTTLLDQISDITRLGAGALPIDRHMADFAVIADRVVQEYQSVDQQHTITFDRFDTKLPGRFDQVRIAQVISAVIGNAVAPMWYR